MTSTTIHVMALDSIVNVNSLFTLALFLGLAFNPADPKFTLVDSAVTATCDAVAGASIEKDLVAFHVYSFSSFLFSSLIAIALKQSIRALPRNESVEKRVQIRFQNTYQDQDFFQSIGHVNRKVLRIGILASAMGSVSGCVFLTLALVDLVQIKLGRLAYWGLYTIAAVCPLVILVPSALVMFICTVLHAFTC